MTTLGYSTFNEHDPCPMQPIRILDISFTWMIYDWIISPSLFFKDTGCKGKNHVPNNFKYSYLKTKIKFKLLNSRNGLDPDLVKDLELQTLRVVVYDKGLRQINIGFKNEREVGAKRGIIAGINIYALYICSKLYNICTYKLYCSTILWALP